MDLKSSKWKIQQWNKKGSFFFNKSKKEKQTE